MIVDMTPDRRRQLEAVNYIVNRDVEYATDMRKRGVVEYWEVAVLKGKGDCEDQALLKRNMLRKFGWPHATLDIAICKLPDGTFHANLAAHTSEGTMILDINYDYVFAWAKLPAGKWIERTVGGSLLNWVEVV